LCGIGGVATVESSWQPAEELQLGDVGGARREEEKRENGKRGERQIEGARADRKG
jgi:hypothetical protein